MKNLSKKLLLSILSIALVVIALGTSTFAWFTLSNQASVGTFNAEVTAGEGMELSLDGTTWFSTIPTDVINEQILNDYAASNYNGTTNRPMLSVVTANESLAFTKLNSAQDGYIQAVANTDYIQLKIWVRAVGLTKINITEIVLEGTETLWKSDTAPFTGANGLEVANGAEFLVSAKNAARIGIVPITPIGTNFVYEHPATTTTGTISGNTVLGGPLTLPTNGQADYFLKKSGAGVPEIGTLKVYPSTPITDSTTGVQVLGLTTGAIYNTAEFNLLVWFEGFDPDTYNSVSALPLTISLKFKGF